MPRTDRLLSLMQILRDGGLHRAEDLARALGVTPRTIYRDIERLKAAGAAVEGTRGRGYRAPARITLPPLSLTPAELEALHLGIAIVAEAGGEEMQQAAQGLAAKIDAAGPEVPPPAQPEWRAALAPLADPARGFAHMPRLRAAIRARQKLRITYLGPASTGQTAQPETLRLRPLQLDYWSRVWMLLAWCETAGDFRLFRLDLIDSVEVLPELFTDEPGKRAADYRPPTPG